MDATLLYLVVTILTVLSGLAYSEWRIRRFQARFAPIALARVQDAFFDVEDVDSPDGKKMRVLRPNERSKQFLAAVVPPFVEYALASVKLKLPKFAPINPSTGALDFTAGIAAKMADGKNVKPEEIAKSLFMQYGAPFIQEKIGPFLQGLTQGGVKPSETAKELPKHLVHPTNK